MSAGHPLPQETLDSLLRLAPTAEGFRELGRAVGASEGWARRKVQEHAPHLAAAIIERGRARKSMILRRENRRQVEARAEVPRPDEAGPLLWALRRAPDHFRRLGVRGDPGSEGEARLAIGRALGDAGLEVALRAAQRAWQGVDHASR